MLIVNAGKRNLLSAMKKCLTSERLKFSELVKRKKAATDNVWSENQQESVLPNLSKQTKEKNDNKVNE